MKHIGNRVQDFNKIHQDSGYEPIPIPRPENFLEVLEKLIDSKKEISQELQESSESPSNSITSTSSEITDSEIQTNQIIKYNLPRRTFEDLLAKFSKNNNEPPKFKPPS